MTLLSMRLEKQMAGSISFIMGGLESSLQHESDMDYEPGDEPMEMTFPFTFRGTISDDGH